MKNCESLIVVAVSSVDVLRLLMHNNNVPPRLLLCYRSTSSRRQHVPLTIVAPCANFLECENADTSNGDNEG